MDQLEPKTEELAETEQGNCSAWQAEEPDGELTYHLELHGGLVTVHFFQEEWDEFLQLAGLLANLPAKK